MSWKVQALILLVSQTPKSTLVSSQPNIQWMWRSWDRALLMYSFKYNQQGTTLYNILYCCHCSTCFRRFLRPSSGAQNCTHSIWYICQACLLLLLAVAASKLDIYQMLCVQFWAPDDGRRNRLKHVEHWKQYRILYNVVPCWLYLKEFSEC